METRLLCRADVSAADTPPKRAWTMTALWLLPWIQHQLSHLTAKAPSPTCRKYPSSVLTGPLKLSSKSQHHFSPKGVVEQLCWSKRGFSAHCKICSSYLIYINMSLDDSFTLSSGHSCRGLEGISSRSHFYPSAEELCPNSCFNPSAWSGGTILCAQAANQHRPPTNKLFDRLTADSGITSVCPAFTQYIPALRHYVYLVDGHFIS